MSIDESQLPLRGHMGFRSSHLAEFSRYLSGSYCQHRVFGRHRGDRVDARHHRALLSNISLNYLQYGAEVEIDPGLFESFYMLELPLSGWTDLDHCGRTVRNRVGTAAIVSPTERIQSLWSEDCGQRMVKIARRAVERQASRLLGRALTEPLVFDPLIDLSSEPGASLVSLCGYLFDRHEGDAGMIGERHVSDEIENALITLLLLGQPSNYSDACRASGSTAVPGHVRRALDFIERNLREDIAMEALIAASAVSARTLYTGFERFVGASPQVYVRNRRLEGVREALLAATAPTTVSELALEWNFNHLGRFSAEYRRRFDELPSVTLRR
ncbi:AraC family transcriptional regulator [Sphingomonas adhaesiva]|uniref:AraC family transcriptional regulator n=1 Tax=Sphingomonas adhaesiva TaxID=28212 RepID=UPI002FFD1502